MSQPSANTKVILGKNKGRADSEDGLWSENAGVPGLQDGTLARQRVSMSP